MPTARPAWACFMTRALIHAHAKAKGWAPGTSLPKQKPTRHAGWASLSVALTPTLLLHFVLRIHHVVAAVFFPFGCRRSRALAWGSGSGFGVDVLSHGVRDGFQFGGGRLECSQVLSGDGLLDLA